MTVSCPAKVTADSGIDALTHAIEAYTAVDNAVFPLPAGERTVYQGKHPLGDLFAESTSPVADITFASDGTLYGWSENTDELVTISKTTGVATVVGASGINTFGSGIAASSGNVLFLTGEGDNGDLRTVDQTTGVTTVVATLDGTAGSSINALAFNGSTLYGSHVVTGTTVELITINTTTAAITVVGPSVDRLDAIVFE